MLLDGFRLVFDEFVQQRTRLLDELGQPLRARSQQLQQPGKRAWLVYKRMRPETLVIEERPCRRRELLDWHPGDVLPVHPIELLRVEHGVAAADALELP